jgi:hypothetical protein
MAGIFPLKNRQEGWKIPVMNTTAIHQATSKLVGNGKTGDATT